MRQTLKHYERRWHRTHLVQLGVQRATELHVLHQVGPLALVGCYDADLVGLSPSLQQLGGDLLHVGSFSPAEKYTGDGNKATAVSLTAGSRRESIPVQVGSSRAGDFLLPLGHVEKHGLVRLGPLEVKPFFDTISWAKVWGKQDMSKLPVYTTAVWRILKIIKKKHTRSDPILQGPFVEDVGGECAESWMHAVLHLQADGSDPQDHQALKEGLGEPSFGCLLTHDHWPQLTVVSYEDELRGGAHITHTHQP